MAVSPHLSRWLVAVVLVPVLIAVIFIGPAFVFDLTAALIGLLALKEYYNLSGLKPGLAFSVLTAAGLILIIFGAGTGSPGVHLACAGIALSLGFVYFLSKFPAMADIPGRLGQFVLGHVYISLFLSFFVSLHRLEQGAYWVFFVLAVTFLSDTAAFYVGRAVGRRPFFPRVSPNKTVEGFLSGVAAAGLTALIVAGWLDDLSWRQALPLGLVMGVWGAMGDLFESMLKRSAGVKDSGGIFLGHGGVLDRIDAVLFNAPLVYAFYYFRTLFAA